MNTILVRIDQETVELIERCKTIFLHHHPDLKDYPISRCKTIKKALEYYESH